MSRTISPVLAAIILIFTTVCASVALSYWLYQASGVAWREDLFPSNPDIYHPDNSTILEAYDRCLEALEAKNYTIYEAKFSRNIWVQMQQFTEFLELAASKGAHTIFVDAPAPRGWFGTGGRKAYIWFYDYTDGEKVTIYYAMEP